MTNTPPIGIMQGRLSPRYNNRYQSFPPKTWKQEFATAGRLGFDCIEFIYDFENYEDSPLVTEDGLGMIQDLVNETGVKVRSICADYFMKFPLHSGTPEERKQRIDKLTRLIQMSSRISVRDITVPCVDDSSLKVEEDKKQLISSLRECLPIAEQCGIKVNLETDLAPRPFAELLEAIKNPAIRINYDIGNSASLGYDPAEEIGAYGRQISVLHIKDRVLRGGSVRLGTGNADFWKVFTELSKIGFNGIFIMQAARAETFEAELQFVSEQLAFARQAMATWYAYGSPIS